MVKEHVVSTALNWTEDVEEETFSGENDLELKEMAVLMPTVARKLQGTSGSCDLRTGSIYESDTRMGRSALP